MKAFNMRTIKKLKPGAKGTKKLLERYGDKLVCVRYRNDDERKRRVKTIELIIEEKSLSANAPKIPMNKMMALKVKYGEVEIGKMIRSAGGKWNRKDKVWKLPYKLVKALGLEDRIITTRG